MRQLAIFVFSFMYLSIPIKSNSNNTFTDSLELEIKDLRGEKKLERMFQIANIYISTDNLYSIGNWIEAEAIKQNNLRYLAGSYNLKARYYLQRKPDVDSVIYYARFANAMYDDNNIKNTNQGHFYIIHAYLEKGYYALAISYLKDLLEMNKNDDNFDLEVYLMMSSIFGLLGNHEIALEYLETMRDLYAFNPILTPDLRFSNYIQTAQHYQFIKMYDKSFTYLAMADSMLQNSRETIEEVRCQQYSFQVTSIITDLYFEKKNLEMTQLYLNKLKKESGPLDLTQSQKAELKSSEAQYYLLIGEYRKALPLFEESIDFIKKYSPAQTHFIIKATKLKMECLRALGRLNEALDTQTSLIQYNDSIYKHNLSTLPFQIAELSETHKLTKVRLQHEKDQAILEKSMTINISLIVAFVLLSTILYAVRRNLKRSKEKNKVLVKQYSELEKYKNVFKENLITSTSKEKQAIEPTLFQQIEMYIEQHEVYRDPHLNREAIAKALSTNENYVAKAIKSMTGKTFVEYINQYRLEYARQRLLTEVSNPVKVILIDAGFSSDTSFYRLFKEAYGMSSSEMRQAQKELLMNME